MAPQTRVGCDLPKSNKPLYMAVKHQLDQYNLEWCKAHAPLIASEIVAKGENTIYIQVIAQDGKGERGSASYVIPDGSDYTPEIRSHLVAESLARLAGKVGRQEPKREEQPRPSPAAVIEVPSPEETVSLTSNINHEAGAAYVGATLIGLLIIFFASVWVTHRPKKGLLL